MKPHSKKSLDELAQASFRRIPLSSDDARDLAAPVADPAETQAAAAQERPAVPPTQALDFDAIRQRVEYIEACANDMYAKHCAPVQLPCMSGNCPHGGTVEISTVRQLDDWLAGRNLCDGCAADRFSALPPDQQDAITALNEKAGNILFGGNWSLMSDEQMEAAHERAAALFKEARALENAWIYGLAESPAELDLGHEIVPDEIEDDLPF